MAAKTASPAPSATGSQDALSLQVSLSQMLDLALGTPEVGAVNLNILHNFLHVLLHQIDLRSTKVEYRGDEANRLKSMMSSSKGKPSVELHEYNIIDASGNVTRGPGRSETTMNVDVFTDEGGSVKAGKPSTSAPVTARRRSTRDGSVTSVDGGNGAARRSTGTKRQIGSGAGSERQSVIFVEPVVNGATPTALGFKRLEDSVKELEQKFQALDELANNPEMIERVRSSKGDPLSDMWHGINVSKRLDASEQGIEKLTTMVQDLIKGDGIEANGSDGGNVAEELGQLGERITQLENNMAYLGGDVAALKDAEGSREMTTRPEDESRVLKNVDGTTDERDDDVANRQRESKKSSPTSTRRSIIGGVDLTELQDDMKTLKSEMTEVQKNVQDLNSRVDGIATEASKFASAADPIAVVADEYAEDVTSLKSKKAASKLSVDGGSQSAVKNRTAESSRVALAEVEEKKKVEGANVEALKKLDSRLTKLEKEVAGISEIVSSEERASGIDDLDAKIQAIQADMERMNEATSRLMDEKDNRATHTDALVEQIELLKTIKADKEDLEDALADKADAQAVKRKVSHDQFDAACDDLARGLEDAITKLSQQESIWQQALDEVQREIEGKLDKVEIPPIKEFVNSRLKTLQEKLKALAEMRRDNEAAGTKKMLSDVQCISCDANAVMRMEEGAHYRAPAMPCTRSVKPYLTYELDQVRKQQRRLPHSRNMIQFEAAMQEMTRKARPLKEDSLTKSPRDHLCNRYCGGSHTTTTPQQRVMRMGHFLTQWGPEAIQLGEGSVLGNDGQLYRSRAMPGKPDVCGPCGDGESADSRQSTTPIPEPAPVAQQQSQLSQRRSSVNQSSKRLSARRTSEKMKDTVEPRVDEVPAEPSTPPSAPPGTIVDESEAIPEPSSPTDEGARDDPSEAGNRVAEEIAAEVITGQGQQE